MARPWRIEYEGALYHILSRGNECRDIFLDDSDRNLSLQTLGKMAFRFDLEVHAYVLMNNTIISSSGPIGRTSQKACKAYEIGDLFGLCYSSISKIAHHARGKIKESQLFSAKYNT